MNDLYPILAHLIAELKAERDRVQLLYDISRRLTGDLELPQALRSILSLSVPGVAGPEGGARGSILLLDEHGQPSDWIVTSQLPKDEQARLVDAAMHGGLWGWLVEHCDIALLEDCRKDPRWLRFPDDPNAAGSAIGAPLVVEGKVRGCLLLIHPRRYFFGPQHVELMRAISSHASVILANALLYRRLELQVEQLAGVNRLQTEFIANMTHELRTPLNAVIGFTELLHDGLSGPVNDVQREQLGRVLRNGRTLLDMISTIMDLSKLEAGVLELQPDEFAVQELIEKVLSSVALQAAAKGLALRVEVDPALPGLLVGDQTRLAQVLVNLVSNAIKFTPAGEVTLQLARGSDLSWDAGDQLPVVVSERQPGDPRAATAGPVWSLAVRDTGAGIAPEHQQLVFERFRQVDGMQSRQTSGAGLGLAIVKKLVAAMDGELYLRSAPGAGSTFLVVLPLQAPETAARPLEATGAAR